MTAIPSSGIAWERYAWIAGILFVLALVADFVAAGSIPVNQNDSAAKIATELEAHRTQLLVIAGVCVVYAAMFPIYLWKLYDELRREADRSQTLASLVLVGGALFVILHAVSDIGITGLLGAKLAAYGAQHDYGLSYSLYLLTFAIDSVGDIFGSLFVLAAGLLSMRSGVLPRWLGWIAIVAALALLPSGIRPRRRHCDIRPGSRPHRICVAPSLRPDQQRRLVQAREIGWRHRSSRVETPGLTEGAGERCTWARVRGVPL